MMSKPRKCLWSQTDILPRRHILDCPVCSVLPWSALLDGASDQRPGFASFIWIFQWWKWKFWPPENLIKFSYLSRCSLSWTTYTFCCVMLQKLFVLQKIFPNFQNGKFLLWTVQFTSRNLKTCKYLKMKICLISYGSFHLSKS